MIEDNPYLNAPICHNEFITPKHFVLDYGIQQYPLSRSPSIGDGPSTRFGVIHSIDISFDNFESQKIMSIILF